MRKCLPLLVFVLIIFGCEKEQSALEDESEKQLKSIEATMVPYKYGEPSYIDEFTWEFKEFDSKGRLVKYRYKPDWDLTSAFYSFLKEETYKYNDKNQLIEKTTDIRRHVYEYNNNLLHKETEYSEHGIWYIYVYEYNGDTLPSGMQSYYESLNNPSISYMYKYDSQKNRIEEYIQYSDSYGILTWEYDSHNNMTKETYFSSEKDRTTVQKIQQFKYDSEDRITEFISSGAYMLEYFKQVYSYKDRLIDEISVFEANDINSSYEQIGVIYYNYEYQ